MSSTGLLLLVTSIAVAGFGIAFMLYKNELRRACEAARRGSLIANTDAGFSDRRTIAFWVFADACSPKHLSSSAGRRACGVAREAECFQGNRDGCLGRSEIRC